MPLGKVVVYRNGVAYFEREARIVGKSLTLSVPSEKVDDFLKSLTVRDKRTGKSLPVSFPSGVADSAGIIEMVIRLPVADGTDVVLSYITESPAWKPSYRVVMSKDGEVELEGWAIVDNTSGENWEDVVIGVGSSSALSFRYDLWSIRDVERQALSTAQRFAVAPPTGSSPHEEVTQREEAFRTAPITQLRDGEYSSGEEIVIEGRAPTIDTTSQNGVTLGADYSKNIPIPGRSFEAALGAASGEAMYGTKGVTPKERKELDRKARVAQRQRERAFAEERARVQRSERRTTALAARIKSSNSAVVIEGYARVGEKEAVASSLARANALRNELINKGVPPALVTAKAQGGKEGIPPGVRVVAANAGANDAAHNPDSSPVGESHFGSQGAMTVLRGTSAMVSIVKAETAGEVVYLYDSESERGNDTFAFKAVRLVNPTNNTLEAGPVTVYGESRFIGEGLTDPIPPNSVALIPFALDRQIVAVKKESRKDRISSLVRLSRGVLTTEVDHTRVTKVELTNRMAKAVTVYVRHTVGDGWELRDAPKKVERLGKAHLFAVDIGAGKTTEVTITESTPMQKLVDMRAETTLDMLQVFLSDSEADPQLMKRIEPLIALQREMSNDVEKIESLRDRMSDYRVRMDELHLQIVTLKAVKSGGSLMRHLKTKLKEVSQKVQGATIALVDTQEKLMVARVRFQDAISEITLEQLTSNRIATTKK